MTVALHAINARSACAELQAKVQADHVSIHPDQLEIPEHRLREIRPEAIRELAESIKEVGLLHPIGVKYAGACTNRYIVIYGAHRALAMQLLRREALEQAANPNTDPEVFRYSQMHALRYRKEIDDLVCQELEIRENFDRKELTFNERKAHLLQLGAIIQRRLKKRNGHTPAETSDGDRGRSTHKHTRVKTGVNSNGGPKITSPVASTVSAATGIHRQTILHRVQAASMDVGKPLSLDETPPEELVAAARQILSKPRGPSMGGGPSPSKGAVKSGGRIRLTGNLYPEDAAAFAGWIRKRYPALFSLDQVRAYRDALIELVKELEAQ